MTAKNFVLTEWYKRIDEITARAKEALETVQKGAGKNLENEVKAYKDRLKQRADFLARELPKLK
jgi:vacuolar-type H+-ATPase subunit E/Vma4